MRQLQVGAHVQGSEQWHGAVPFRAAMSGSSCSLSNHWWVCSAHSAHRTTSSVCVRVCARVWACMWMSSWRLDTNRHGIYVTCMIDCHVSFLSSPSCNLTELWEGETSVDCNELVGARRRWRLSCTYTVLCMAGPMSPVQQSYARVCWHRQASSTADTHQVLMEVPPALTCAQFLQHRLHEGLRSASHNPTSTVQCVCGGFDCPS